MDASPTGLNQVAIVATKSFAIAARVGRTGLPDDIADAPLARKSFVSDEGGASELVILTVDVGGASGPPRHGGHTTRDRAALSVGATALVD